MLSVRAARRAGDGVDRCSMRPRPPVTRTSRSRHVLFLLVSFPYIVSISDILLILTLFAALLLYSTVGRVSALCFRPVCSPRIHLCEYAYPRFSLAFRLLVISFIFVTLCLLSLVKAFLSLYLQSRFPQLSIMHHLSFDSNNLERHVDLSLIIIHQV